MVWNLLANALKFTSAGGRVEVKVDRAGADVRITVSDTGCGISSEFLPFIFDRFRQADSTRTRFHGGLGLGLAIVRHLVELHGGTVQAESAGIGSGSTFTIRLPLAERSSSRTAEPALFPEQPERVAAALPALDNVRVLLVDDDADGLHLLATALADRRASVETALSTTQALEVLEWYKPDVLVSDLAMPDEDGYSLIAKIRATEQGSKVLAVALTAYVRIEDRARAFSAGYNMFVPKPGRTNGVGNRHRQPGERGKLRIAAIHSGVVPS